MAGSNGQLTRAPDFTRISSEIKYCALLDGSGGIIEDFSPEMEVDGRSHLDQFKDLAASIGLTGVSGAPAPSRTPPGGAPRFALMCLEEHDLLVTKTPVGTVAVVLKKGSWPAAIADRLRRGGPQPRSVQLAGWVILGYVAAAIVPGLILVGSILLDFYRATIALDPVQYVTLGSGNLTVLLGLTGLISLPGYLRGDVGWRRTITWTLVLNFITWLFPLGFLLPPFILFCVIPIIFLVLNRMADSKVYFNVR